MNQKTFFAFFAILILSACSTIDDLTVSDSYDLTFNAEEEAYIDWYLNELEDMEL